MSRTKLLARLRAIAPTGRSSGGIDFQRFAAPVLTVIICVLLLVVAGRLVPAATRNPAELYERRRLRPRAVR